MRFRRYRRVVQTISYMPHFISWVIVASLFNSLLSIDGGAVNELLVDKLKWLERPFPFLTSEIAFIFMAILIPLWKGICWSSIVYLAAIASVNAELYQAAAIDGANRFQRIWYVTIPAILPTAIILFLLGTGGILSGFDFYFLFGNASNTMVSRVLDIHTYETGLVQSQFSQATAVGLFKSIVGMTIVIVANLTSKRVAEFGLFSSEVK